MEGKNMISYCKYFNSQSDVHTISHDDFDANSVDVKYFVEILKGLEVVRPYYDLDEEKINNKQDWDNFIAELERLRGSLGDYCIAGYTTDKALHEITGLKYYESIVGLPADKEQKKISMHVVFYEAVVKINDWLEIVKKNSQYEQPKFNYDHEVYKLKTSQLMRHSLSYKPYRPQEVIQCSGNIIVPEDAKNSYACITPRGNETVLELSDYDDVFPKKTTVDDTKIDKLFARHDAKQKVVKQEVEGEEITNIDEAYKTKSFTMSKACFEALYKGFEGLTIHGDKAPCNEEISLWPLFSALYVCVDDVNITDDDVDDALAFIKEHAQLTENAKSKWDSQLRRAAANKNCTGPGALFTYMRIFNNDYYIKNVKKYCLCKCVVDDDTKFDLKDEFCVSDIREKGFNNEYQLETNEKLNYNAVLRDLRKVLIVVDQGEGLYVLKERDAENDRMTVRFYNQKTMFSMLKQLKVGTELKNKKYKEDEEHIIETKSAFDVYNASTNNKMFYKSGIRFYSTNPRDFSFYQGYKYNAVRNDVLIEKFNNHIKNIWCKGNEELYNYVQSWFATVIQKPLGRCGTALVIKGIEGTGKNTITDVWCELLAGYANSNVSDIDSIVGKFNTAVENKKLLVCNEMDSADMNTTSVFNRLKKLITEKSVDIHTKNVSVRTGVQNVSNYIFISNEFNPVKITGTDRRYCIITPSEEVAGDNDYFDKLYDVMKDDIDTYKVDFMEALMYYYMNYDVKIKLNNIPETLERVIAKQANKSAIESFVEEYCVELSEDGLKPDEAFDNFNRFVVKNGYQTKYKKTTFKAEMTKYCAVYDNGQLKIFKKQRVYRFTDANIKKYAKMVEEKKAEECVDDSDSE